MSNASHTAAMPSSASTALSEDRFAGWPPGLKAEMESDAFNGCVGSVLVSEDERVRVWHLRLAPGVRCNFHRHVQDYFWTCHSEGRARGYFDDGRVRDVVHYNGETKHFRFGPGEYMLHSVENVGESELLFTTVEFHGSANTALPIPDWIRLAEKGAAR